MAFARPTLATIVSRVVGDLETELQTNGSVLRRSMLRILAIVVAGTAHMLYGAIAWASRQVVVSTSDEDYLSQWASLYGMSKNPPTFARGEVTFTADATATVPAHSILTRSDGAQYELLADVHINIDTSATADGEVLALTAGAAGSLPIGTLLTLQIPVSHVQSTASVVATLEDGNDQEGTEDFRTRFREFLASPPQGGNKADFIAWSKEVTGVTRAWPVGWELGPGTVTVRFARDGDVSPIPDVGEVAAMQAHLDEEAPLAAHVMVSAPVPLVVSFSIRVKPFTEATTAAVKTRLQERFRRAVPGEVIPVSQIATAVGSAEGVVDFYLVFPTFPVTPTAEQLPILDVDAIAIGAM